MKRFWTETAVAREGEHHSLLLDGKPMRLPGGEVLPIRSRDLAEALAEEWRQPAPGAEITPAQLPLTQLAATALLRIPGREAAVAESIAAYGRSDLLCYRAAEPAALAERQHAAWQPWLDWAWRQHDAPLRVTQGIAFVDQPAASLAALARAVGAQDQHGLAALGVLVPAYGSLVLGLAVIAAALDPVEAYRLSVLDTLYQEERWGAEPEAVARRAAAAADVSAAARYFTLTREQA